MTVRTIAVLLLLGTLAPPVRAASDDEELIKAVLAAPGLVVHLPATDGRLESALAASGRVLVQGLALDDKDLGAARGALFAAGQYGAASVRRIGDPAALPFASNLVTHLIVDADALGGQAPDAKECLRVLHPNGTLHLRRDGTRTRTVKPMPQGYGEWTHAYGGPDGAMRSSDREVAAPAGLRWISGPACHDEGAVANGYRVGDGVAVHDLHLAPGAGDFRWMEGRNAFNGLPAFLVPLRLDTYKTRPMVLGGGKIFTYLRDATVRANGEVEGDPGPLVALDAATGKLLLTFSRAKPYAWYDTGKRQRHPGNNLLFAAGTLYQTAADRLQAFDPDNGDLRWTWSAGEGNAVDFPSYCPAHNYVVVARGRWERLIGRNPRMNASHVVALDATTGKEVWRTALDRTGVAEWSRDGGKPVSQIACAGDGVYLYRSGGISALKMPRGRGGYDSDTQYLAALDARTGEVRWHHEGFDSPDRKGGDNDKVFDVGGQKLEMTVRDDKIYLMSGGVATFDARTGRKLSVYDFGNSRCDASHAAGSLLVLGFGNLIDLSAAEPRVIRSEIVRGHCATGLFPAYGMIYGTPSRCRCAEVLHGYMALSGDAAPPPLDDERRLARGEAGAFTPPKQWPAREDWPIFLGDPARSASSQTPPERDLKILWRTSVARPVPARNSLLSAEWHLSGTYNGPVSAPTVAGERLFVAVPYEHRVEARSLKEEGKKLWSFTAGGRVDSPPTIYGDLCLFGGHDGCVYCLDAATGALRWKFLAAPADRQIVAYGQAESAWPLFGSLVVAGGTVVAVAGYHPETDGGLFAWGLEPATGAVRWKRTIRRERRWLPVAGRRADEPSYVGGRFSGGYNSNNIRNTLAVSDGVLVSIQGFTFDAATGKPTTDVRPAAAPRRSAPPPPDDAVDVHMDFSLAFNERSPERTTLYDTFRGPGHHNGTWDFAVPRHDFRLDALRIARRGDRVLAVPNGGWHASDELELRDVSRGSPRKSKPLWKIDMKTKGAVWVGLVLAGDTAVVVRRVLGDPMEDRPGKSEVELRSVEGGELLQSVELPVPPIENGVAAAGGRLYLTLLDGSVLCLGH